MLDMDRYSQMLEWVKMLQPFNSDDESTEAKETYEKILTFALSKTIRDVSNYTNILTDDLPKELDHTIASMAAQLIDTHNFLSIVNGNPNTDNIQSLNEGDTSITFKSKSEVYGALEKANTITDAYVDTLNNFRKVKW